MIAIDLLRLDREVRAAAAALDRAYRALASGDLEAGVDPLDRSRHLSSKASFVELSELPPDPLIEALRGWIGHLTLERVGFRDRVAVATAFHERRHRSRVFEREVSARELFDALLAEKESRARRLEIGEELSMGARAASDAARLGAERRIEAARLLGAPVPTPCWTVDAGLVQAAAREIVAETRAAIGASGREGEGWPEALAATLGRDATEGWPAALKPRWVFDAFRGSVLVAGLAVDLGGLPTPLGATSFARALGRFGRAVAEADLPQGMPFSIARAADDPLAARREALFASLTSEPAFCRRVLGLGRAAAREQSRRVALALTHSLRLEALRPLLADALGDAPARREARADDETNAALGAPLPAGLLGVVPRLWRAADRRFVALLLAASDRVRLRETFDEDWFANPRALEALRDEHHRPASTRAVDAAQLERAVAATRAELAASLS